MIVQNNSIWLYLSIQIVAVLQFLPLIISVILNCGGKAKNPTSKKATTVAPLPATEAKSVATQATQGAATATKTQPKTEPTEQVEAKSVEDEKKDTTAGTGAIATTGPPETEKTNTEKEPKSVGAAQATTRSEAAAFSQVIHQMPSLALGTEKIPEKSMATVAGNAGTIGQDSPLADLGNQPSLCLMTENFSAPPAPKNVKTPAPAQPKPEPPKKDANKKEAPLNKPSIKAKPTQNDKKQDVKKDKSVKIALPDTKPTNATGGQKFVKKSDPNYNQYATLAIMDDIPNDDAKSSGLKK